LIAPLFQGRSEHELVALVAGEGERSAHELVREHWRAVMTSGAEGDREREDPPPFEHAWRRALHEGLVAESALAALALTPRADLDLGEPPAEVAFDDAEATLALSAVTGRGLDELVEMLERLAARRREIGTEPGDGDGAATRAVE
jgi:molybdopterin-containing oxidoreductase family iron-sulfur binding subunit